MSVSGLSGIFTSNLFNQIQNTQSQRQQFQQEFQQLGQDLTSGNLSAAQADFAALQQLAPQSNSSTQTQSGNPIAQEFQQLSQDLQSGNLPAAQQDYTTIQQDVQNQAASRVHHHHHHEGGGSSEVSQLFTQLGQDLQSGNLSQAQQAYSAILKDLPQLSQGQTSSNASGVSVSA
ncbi:MAG TPA: hypothetical protein VMG31_16745 [Verrucomicrobiae bacterium]|nr:hypothetical protein [Verrucomicrobiae bacterium]